MRGNPHVRFLEGKAAVMPPTYSTASAFAISKAMGHSDIAMTQRYINLSKDDLRKTMTQVWEQTKVVSA